MKLLHTADWHLGKIINGISMIEDQKYIIRQIIEIAKKEEVDAIILAGDLYDRSIPPTDAVTLLNDTLYELNITLQIPIFAISGNHDSAERLSFGTNWYEKSRFYLAGKLLDGMIPIEFHDTQIWLVPYHDALTAKAVLHDSEIQTYNDAMAKIIEQITPQQDPTKAQILVGHAFVAGGVPSDSERVLSIGNVDRVAVDNFVGFDYVALGHLHHPNALNHPSVKYSGSPLKYSFSEVEDIKSINIVEFSNNKLIGVRPIQLTPLRDMRIIEGYLDNLLNTPEMHSEDYVQINLLDEGALIDPINKLRQVFPNIMHLERKKHTLSDVGYVQFTEVIQQDQVELFEQFFQYTKGKELTDNQKEMLIDIIEQAERGDE